MKSRQNTVCNCFILNFLLGIGLLASASCGPRPTPEADVAVRDAMDQWGRFMRALGEFYQLNRRWPVTVDEMADLNSRSEKPFKIERFRPAKLEVLENDALGITFKLKSDELRFKISPPDANGMARVTMIPSSQFVR